MKQIWLKRKWWFPVLLFLCQMALPCSAGLQLESSPLLAGTAVVDITPAPDVPLAGPIGGSGKATTVHDRLFARALAIQSGDIKFVICICDITIIATELHDRIRAGVARRSGLPPQQLLVAATHTHRSPRAMDLELGPAHERFKNRLVAAVIDAVQNALDHLEPARIGWASVNKPEHCRNRRWLMKPGTAGPNPFGDMTDQVKMYGGPGTPGIRTAGPIDPELFVFSVQRPDGSQISLLANFNIHYGSGGGGVSADYFGHFSRVADQVLGGTSRRPVVAMMSNGTSGNIAPGGNPARLGADLAHTAAELVQRIDHQRVLPIQVHETQLTLAIRKPDKARLEWARAVLAGTWNEPAHPWKNKYAKNAIWLSHYPDQVSVRLQVVRLGELAIIALPCEVYAETGLAVKRQSPFADTFSISLANGYHGYLPTPEQHRLGGYTTWPAVSSYLEVGAEPKIRAAAMGLLEEAASEN